MCNTKEREQIIDFLWTYKGIIRAEQNKKENQKKCLLDVICQKKCATGWHFAPAGELRDATFFPLVHSVVSELCKGQTKRNFKIAIIDVNTRFFPK